MINNRYSYKRKKNKAKTKNTKGGGLRRLLFRSIFGSASVTPSDDFNSDGVHEGPGVVARRDLINAELTSQEKKRKDIRNYRTIIQSILNENAPHFARHLTSKKFEFGPYMANTDPLSDVKDSAYEQKLSEELVNTTKALKEIQDHYITYISPNSKSGGKKSKKSRKSRKYRK